MRDTDAAHLGLICVVSLTGLLTGAGAVWSQGDSIVITDVTVISPERARPLVDADVVIRNGRIVRIGRNLPENASLRQINGSSRFLIPGLIDSHVHVGHSAALDRAAIAAHPQLWAAYRAQVPRAYLSFGFTSVVDLDTEPDDKAWFNATPLHPRMYSCGPGIRVAGGYGAFKVPEKPSPSSPNVVYEPQEAKSWPATLNPAEYTADHAVGRAVAVGGDCVKAFVESGFGIFNWPYLPTNTLRAIRTATSGRNLPLFVHATSVDSWRSAIDAHAGVIAHGLWIWPGDVGDSEPPKAVRDVVRAAGRAGIRAQPTLQTVAGERAFLDSTLLDDPRIAWAFPTSVTSFLRSAPGEKARLALLDAYRKASPAPGFEPLLTAMIQRTQKTFKLMLQERISLILGSDTPAGDGFGNPPGLNGRLEMQAWAENGAPPMRILRAATLDNATVLGIADEVGSIQVGKRADLLLLARNPLADVSAYDSIETIILNGQPIARETLRPHD
jgi:imidazolonepropionase-like amidohydrolase